MRRNVIALALSALLFPLSVPAQAQQARRVYRVGFLSGGFPSTTGIEAMRRELRELGYVEGKNIIFEYRYAEAKPERSASLAHDLVRLKVDAIVASGSSDTVAAKNATKTIPIVFLESVSDPVSVCLIHT